MGTVEGARDIDAPYKGVDRARVLTPTALIHVYSAPGTGTISRPPLVTQTPVLYLQHVNVTLYNFIIIHHAYVCIYVCMYGGMVVCMYGGSCDVCFYTGNENTISLASNCSLTGDSGRI